MNYKYRINPTKLQAQALDEMLRDFCELYNAALQQRIEAYRRQGKSLSYMKQGYEIRALRSEIPSFKRWAFSAETRVLRRLDHAYKAFFRRKKGFPRFRAASRYHAADFCVGDGLSIRPKSSRIGIVGVEGDIKVRWHRKLPGKPKSAILSRQNNKWFVCFHVEQESAITANGEQVGIDLGLDSLVALSTGETVARPNWTKRAKAGMRRQQRAISRSKIDSKVRARRLAALAVYKARVANRRRDGLHKLSRSIVNRFGHIAVEVLRIKGLSAGPLAKEVNDAAWGMFVLMLSYKAENAGGEVIKVEARGTSQTCPECGTIAKKSLDERTHRCDCGCTLDRDVAAAMVVHYRAFGVWPGIGLGSVSQRVAA